MPVQRVEWLDKKRNINGMIRKAKEVHVFIHSDYFERPNLSEEPRHKVTISYAIEFIESIPEDKLPGLAVLEADPLILVIIPRAWKEWYK